MRDGSGGPAMCHLGAKAREEDAADLEDGLGLPLDGVLPPDDQLGLDAVDVRALVLDDAVVARLDGAVTLDSDDRVGGDPGVDGDLLQREYEWVSRRHVVHRRGQAAARDAPR